MDAKQTSLRIAAKRLGTVTEVTSLLIDLEFAYNSIYAFNFLVDTLVYDKERNLKHFGDQYDKMRKNWLEFYEYKNNLFDPFMYELFFEEYSYSKSRNILPNLIELQSKINIEKIVLPTDRLYISKVNIQSLGFWEVLGNLNPLQQIREYIKDRHERKKDNMYRNRQEEEIGELEIDQKRNKIINERVTILRKLGYNDLEIRQLVNIMITEPLDKLGRHQDNGQIEGQDE